MVNNKIKTKKVVFSEKSSMILETRIAVSLRGNGEAHDICPVENSSLIFDKK